jgi:DNA-binding transcriptional LysR family regulator
MDWDKLRIFRAVAEAGSFTHAGEKLNLSQSAVSRQISSLENSLGVMLFHRHARGLLLTEEGEILEQAAQEIFGKLAMIEGRLSDSRAIAAGPLRITVAEFIGSTWLAPRLGNFHAQYPEIQLSVLQDDRILNLGMREADAGIRLYEPQDPDLIQRHLTTIQFHICASEDYLAEHGKPKSMKDLKKHTLIAYPDGLHGPYPDANWLLHAAQIEVENNPKLILINSIQAIHRAVRNNAGIAVLPDFLLENDDRIVQILTSEKPPSVDMFFVYPEERRNSKRIGIFRDFLLDSVSKTHF